MLPPGLPGHPPSQVADASLVSLVGVRGRVGGRLADAVWDGRPKRKCVKVAWSDDGSVSARLPIAAFIPDEAVGSGDGQINDIHGCGGAGKDVGGRALALTRIEPAPLSSMLEDYADIFCYPPVQRLLF